MYNVIFFADIAYSYCIARSHGTQRLASELRRRGYSVLLINYISTMDFKKYEEILSKAVGPETYLVGLSTTWFPYFDKNIITGNNRRTAGTDPKKRDEYEIENQPWFFESLPWQFTQEDPQPWIKAVKKINPKTKFIIGGTKSAEYVEVPNIDHVFIGYSETMMIEFVDSLSKKGPRLLFNKVIDYDPGAEKNIWDFRSSKTEYSEDDIVLPNDTLGMEFARGCIFSCSFCSFPLIGKKNVNDFLKYKETIYEELYTNYTKYGIKKYFIVDDTFNDSLEKLELIADVVRQLPFQPYFWAYTRVDLFHSKPKMPELMYEIGVREVNFGIESFHPETSKIIKKGNADVKKKSLKLAREVWGDEVYIGSNYILGLPKEPQESMIAAAQWFDDEGYKYTNEMNFNALTLLNAFGKQSLYLSDIERNYEKYGYELIPDRPGSWNKNDGSDVTSRDQCLEIIEEIYDIIGHRRDNKVYKNLFHCTTYTPIDERLNIEKLLNHSEEEFIREHGHCVDTKHLYKEFTDTIYWPKVFSILNKNEL